MVGGLVSVVVGGLADTANRCKLFMWIVLLGELSCLGTYLVATFEQLLLCRILTGACIIIIHFASVIVIAVFDVFLLDMFFA